MTLPLLVLRPEPGATATAARAEALGLEVVKRPLFAVKLLPFAMPTAATLLLTSLNSVRSLIKAGQACSGLRAYVVGEATASAARAVGIEVLASAPDLARLTPMLPPIELLHVAGEVRTPMPETPARVSAVTAYRTQPLPVRDWPRGGVAMLHSTAAAARFAQIAPRNFVVVAISARAAAAAGEGWPAIHVAAAPDDASMLAMAAPLCLGAGR